MPKDPCAHTWPVSPMYVARSRIPSMRQHRVLLQSFFSCQDHINLQHQSQTPRQPMSATLPVKCLPLSPHQFAPSLAVKTDLPPIDANHHRHDEIPNGVFHPNGDAIELKGVNSLADRELGNTDLITNGTRLAILRLNRAKLRQQMWLMLLLRNDIRHHVLITWQPCRITSTHAGRR